MAKCRDFSSVKLKEFDKFMDEYFSEEKSCKWYNKILQFFGIFGTIASSANSDYKDYIKSLAKTDQKATTKIKNVWLKIEQIEKEYYIKYNYNKESLGAIKNLLLKLNNSISNSNFSSNIDFNALLMDCFNDQSILMEQKAYNILEKDVENWTNEDYEVLSYVFINGENDEIKEKILNSFYVDKTDEHVIYDGLDGLQRIGSTADKCTAYEFRNDEWNKFKELTELYYCEKNRAYMNNELSDDQMNECIRNYMTIMYVDKNIGKVTYTTGEPPIKIDSSGILNMSVAKVTAGDKVHIRNGQITEALSYRTEDLVITKTFDTRFNIQNGNDASVILKTELADEAINESSYDYSKQMQKTVQKYLTKTMDTIIPGTGKATNIIIKIGTTAYDAVKETDMSQYNKMYQSEYVERFSLKCCMTSDGYVILPTPETKEKFDSIMTQLKEQGYTEIYDTFYREDYMEYLDGTFDFDLFCQAIDKVLG